MFDTSAAVRPWLLLAACPWLGRETEAGSVWPQGRAGPRTRPLACRPAAKAGCADLCRWRLTAQTTYNTQPNMGCLPLSAVPDRLCSGQRGLAAAARAADGRGPATSLVQALCQACRVAKPQDLIRCCSSLCQACRVAKPQDLIRCCSSQQALCGSVNSLSTQSADSTGPRLWQGASAEVGHGGV